MAHFLENVAIIEIVLCVAIVLVAAVVQMSIGMGFGMLASPMIALVKPEIVPGTIMLIGLVVALSGAWRERENISLQELKLGIGGRIAGSALAFVILLQLRELGLFIMLFGVLMLVAVLITASGMRFPFNDRNLLGLSVVSGLMGTITAVGAPPMAIIYHDRPPSIVRPTLNAFFASGCILGLISLAASGWLHRDDFVFSTILLPAMFVGIRLSRYFSGISSAWLSRALLGLSGVASLLLIIQGASNLAG